MAHRHPFSSYSIISTLSFPSYLFVDSNLVDLAVVLINLVDHKTLIDSSIDW